MENSRPSDAYFEVEKRCKGEFEKTKTYQDIIDRQIEKMFISTSIDREYEGVRRDYRLSPVMLLYKVLLELGKAEGKKEESYRISMTEYRMFLATTKRYEEFLDTILYIRLFRNDVFAKASFEEYKDKFDNRFVMALKQLSTLETGKDYIALKPEKIAEVAKKVFEYENMDVEISDQELQDLLCSTKEVTCTKKEEEKTTQRQVDKPYNRIIYGAPGTGKSYCLRQDLSLIHI